MYAAKAAAIRKVALDVWAPGRELTDKSIGLLDKAIHEIYAQPNVPPLDVELSVLLPLTLRHKEFVYLVRSLAANPLVA